jgi:hypothetical protein
MNDHKLTQPDLETYTRWSKLQILLLVIFIPCFAVPGLAQVTSGVREQRESVSADVNFTFNNSSIDLDHKYADGPSADRKRFSSLWAKAIGAEETLEKVSVAPVATTSRLTQQVRAEAADGSSGGATSQPASPSGKFAVFVDAGAAVPHGDFSAFFDPGFSLNAGLEYMITSQFSAEGTFGYHRFSTFFGGHTNLFQLSGNGKFYLVDSSSNVRPFINGGVGAYVSNSGTVHFGGNIGGGVLYEATPRFGIQGSYNFHAVSAGSSVRFSTLQGGVRFRF